MTIAALAPNVGIPLPYANRHGLITGATGTGKTVSIMTLCEQFVRAGVPVFVADVKGDIGALARSCPAQFLDVFGRDGLPLQVTIAAMQPDLLARALDLSDTQAAVVEIAFAFAAAEKMRLDTISDLRAVLRTMAARREHVSATHGNVTLASIGVIQRAVLRLESQGADEFFKGPQFDIERLLQSGKVSILRAERLIESPRVYAAFLLWLLREFQSRLPEAGDTGAPRLVMFFDEAHLIFQDCPPALLRRIEQTVRLIRSKGVGIYFASQSPADFPEIVKAQLAHRIAHDRSLPIGTARFDTLTSVGAPAEPRTVKVNPPTCALGPLSGAEQAPFMPALSSQPESRPRSPVSFEMILLALVLMLTAGAGFALWHYWESGISAKVIAGLFGVAFAGSLKR